MKLREGLGFIALIFGMGLAFVLNHAGKPIWFSLLAGFVAGLSVYFCVVWLKHRGLN